MSQSLNIKPTWKQHQVYQLAKTKLEILFGGGAGGGKSFLIAEICLLHCLQYPGIRTAFCRKEKKDIRSTTFLSFLEVCEVHNIDRSEWQFNGQDNFISFTNGSRIDFIALHPIPSDPNCDFLGSYGLTFACIDEASEISEVAYDKLLTRVGRKKNEDYNINAFVLATANPHKGFLYYRFYDLWRKNELPEHRAFIQALPNDNEYLDKKYIENLKNQSEVNRQRYLEGNWLYQQDDSALVTIEAIHELWSNEDVLEEGMTCITADIALQGSDLFVIAVWRGYVVLEFATMEKSDGKEVITQIQKLADKYDVTPTRIVYDSDGVGAMLSGWLKRSIAFHGNGKPSKGENYANMKAQCGFRLAKKIMENGIFLKTDQYKEEIVQELEQLKNGNVDNEGKLRLLPKAEIKKSLGRSPDFMDVLLMRMYPGITPYKSKQKPRLILS